MIVRATALSLLAGYPGEDTDQAVKTALVDDEALIRRTATQTLRSDSPEALARYLGPLLYDPVRAVRHEAARRLVGKASGHLDSKQTQVFREALGDYESSMRYSADFAFGRFNLANLYLAQGDTDAVEKNYLAAIDIDTLFYPSKVNLAMMYNKEGRNGDAEKLFREVVAENPNLYEISYSLGLLLTEEKKYEEAAVYLKRAAAGLPDRARVHYNLGMLLALMGRKDASTELRKALELEPDNMDFLYALADCHLQQNRIADARQVVTQMIEQHPESAIGPSLMRVIDQASNTRKKLGTAQKE